jgi:hypothetical protein
MDHAGYCFLESSRPFGSWKIASIQKSNQFASPEPSTAIASDECLLLAKNSFVDFVSGHRDDNRHSTTFAIARLDRMSFWFGLWTSAIGIGHARVRSTGICRTVSVVDVVHFASNFG